MSDATLDEMAAFIYNEGGDLSDATLDEMAAFIYNEGGGSLLPPGDIKLLKGS